MFEFLEDIPAGEVISGVYYAIRLITHRHQIINVNVGLRVEGLESEPTSDDEELAVLIVGVIENTEGAHLKNIDDSSAEEYIGALANIAQQRAVKEFSADIDRGRELLGRFEPAMGKQVGQNSA